MSELAFNIQGEPFETHAQATLWRLKLCKGKGPAAVAFGRDGLPAHLPIDATLDDLKAAVTVSGRYRLDQVDQNNKTVADAPSAYVQVNLDATSTLSSMELGTTAKPTGQVVIEAIRSQSAMALAVIERFPQMMDSAANLLRAADGAGLPARGPRTVPNAGEEADDDDHHPGESAPRAPAFDLNAFVAQIVPVIVMSLTSGKMKLPGFGEIFDWRKAAPTAPQAAHTADTALTKHTPVRAPGSAAGLSTTATSAARDVTAALPPIAPQTMMHFIAIQTELAPAEAALAREVASELGSVELRAWFDELSALSVPDAVAKIRTLIGGDKPIAAGALS